jgi:hypothetical protein
MSNGQEVAGNSNENYRERLYTDAIHWFGEVALFDYRLPKPDTDNNRSNGRVLEYLGNKIAESDFSTVFVLATLEREARVHISETEEPDTDAQDTARVNQFYALAGLMKEFVDFDVVRR